MSHEVIRVGDRVRRAPKRGRAYSGHCLGRVIEVTDRLARVQTGKVTTTWPLKILEVMPNEMMEVKS